MNPTTKCKQGQRNGKPYYDIKWLKVAYLERKRQQLDPLCIARAGAGKPYSVDEDISPLIRRDWERWQESEVN
jgi:hypothetical protein